MPEVRKRLAVIEQYIGTGAASTLSKLGIDPTDPMVATVILHNVEVVDDPTLLPPARERMFKSFKTIEQRISNEGGLSTEHDNAGLTHNSTLLLGHTTEINKKVFSLSDEAAERLLAEVLPQDLFLLLGVDSVSEALKQMPARGLLALTRHTEKAEWKEMYFKKISELTVDDFSMNTILVNPLPDSLFMGSLSKPIYEKPWGLSHAKEVGVISMFPKDYSAYATPNLLLAAVYAHYVEELNFASHHFLHVVEQNESVGDAVAKLIENDRKPLEALRDKNVYDETLYWDRGLIELHKHWLLPDESWFIDQDKALAIPNAFVSLNAIDSLWSLNLESSCTYHFRQALWCNIVKHFSHLDNQQYEQVLIENLSEKDMVLSKKILSSQ